MPERVLSTKEARLMLIEIMKSRLAMAKSWDDFYYIMANLRLYRKNNLKMKVN